ncbi:uncharacterized protein LOC106717641 [Papilio machaon]|uniref:uncharacterized protein LOC106717641 n=1 Tax=Papilio machaon TaxID=76193 RepID=UPI001E6639D6|nr:uncharacterized protein LOC106717641 [Papilio machaon]
MISDGEQEIDYDARVTKRRVRVPIVSDDNSDICRIGVRMPPFWPEKPLLWFSQIESQFCISKITDDDIKFHFLITNLDRRYISDIEDLITSPPTTGKYEKLKSEIIKRLSISKEKKLKQLLQAEEMGDRKPSQFLRHLQHLAGPNIPEDFLRSLWTGRLPSNLQTIVVSQMSMPLSEIADLADRVHDIVPASPVVAAASSSQTRLEQTIEDMARQMSELKMQNLHGQQAPIAHQHIRQFITYVPHQVHRFPAHHADFPQRS